jgi:hypothetical protein
MTKNTKEDRQYQRQKYIDLCVFVLGGVSRKLIMSRFEVKDAIASRDIQEYIRIAGNVLTYNHKLRMYLTNDWFTSIFNHTTDEALDLIGRGIQRVACISEIHEKVTVQKINTATIELDRIFPVLRSLFLNKKVEIEYVSRSSGSQVRLVAPHSIIATGTYTYIRAFDHKSGEFRTFKLNRVLKSTIKSYQPEKDQGADADSEWNTYSTLIVIPNPKSKHPKAIELDNGMVDGKLEVIMKKALIPFFLMDWHIAPQGSDDLPESLFPMSLQSIS